MWYKSLIIFSLISFSTQLAVAQYNTNSPYTLYGYGELNDNYSGEQRARGGTAIAASSKTSINVVNPASYASIDSLTFMMDIGTSLIASRFKFGDNSTSRLNANLEYLTMQFPLWKNTGFSMGILPFSFTGYNYSYSQMLDKRFYPEEVTATSVYYGQGGISQAYSGFSAKFFEKLSVGVNAYYMFGNVVNSRELLFDKAGFTPGYKRDSIKVNSFRFRYGMQFKQDINVKNTLTIGAYYEAKTPLQANFTQTIGSSIDVPLAAQPGFSNFEMPQAIGVGLQYEMDKRLVLAADYSLQEWSKTRYMGVLDTLANRNRFALGVEFLPNARGRNYFDRVSFRMGLNMSDPYYKINGAAQPQNYGITFGMGLPLRNTKTVLNTTIEYGKIGSNTSLREDYLKFTLNAIINETWFFKRKL